MSEDNKKVRQIAVQINSQCLKDLLKAAVGSYPGTSLDTKDISLVQPCRLLYHYRREIKKEGEKFKSDSESAAHIQVLLDYIQDEHGETIKEAENLREKGVMTYQHLWTLFKPGSIVLARTYGQIQAHRVLDYTYQGGSCPHFAIRVSHIDFDGQRFGTDIEQLCIPPFAGALPINKLDAVPREYYHNTDEVQKRLVERGRQFEKYAGMHFLEHSGVAMEHVTDHRGNDKINRVNIDGRVVVDCATHHRLNPNIAFSVKALDDGAKPDARDSQSSYDSDGYDDDSDEETEDWSHKDAELTPNRKLNLEALSDEQCLLSSALVRGFSFTEKKWVDMFVDNLTPIVWNERCFDQLVLQERQKKLIQALVAEHITNKSDFDDIIKGKGKGLVSVLHGPPGVGKTLTAECVAERCKRPLYVVSSGDLGTDSSTLDERLSRILDMASTWRAVLLIDEADVFLERRSLHDMERNALVSIFLRVLEYYQGILFLTSNRVNTFDDAFKSRIHVPLKYTNLDPSSRKQIWKNFLSKADGSLNNESLEKLAVHELNGRQIKGIVRTATSLARYDNETLSFEVLEQIIGIQMEFERDLDGIMEN